MCWLTPQYQGVAFAAHGVWSLLQHYAEPSKSVIIVKEDNFQKATALFADLQVEVVFAGQFLGSCIGNEEGIR